MANLTAGEKIYDNYINNQPELFWSNPSHQGVEVLKACKEELSKLGWSDLISGSYHQTYTTVGTMINILQRRIERWQSYLDSVAHNN